MPFLASFFDGMSGVKKLPKVIPVKTRTTSAYIPSFLMRHPAKQRMFCLISVRYPGYPGRYIRVLTLFSSCRVYGKGSRYGIPTDVPARGYLWDSDGCLMPRLDRHKDVDHISFGNVVCVQSSLLFHGIRAAQS